LDFNSRRLASRAERLGDDEEKWAAIFLESGRRRAPESKRVKSLGALLKITDESGLKGAREMSDDLVK